MADERSRLGRGLAALIGDVGAETPAGQDIGRKPRRAPIENIRANPRNPRRTFTEAELDELTASVRERGVIQPIVVRAVRGADDKFEIIAGERRWRAAQRAGLHEVPVVVVEATDAQSLELAIIENVQRADLNALEEAAGYQALIDTFSHSQDDVAQIVGKSRSHVANTLRLLKLPDAVKAHLAAGKLTAGHARMLVGQPNAAEIANDIVSRGLNVRQVEALARDKTVEKGKSSKPASVKDADMRAIEKRLSDALGLKVSVDQQGKTGTVRVIYRDLEQLDEIIRRLERR
ncbi:MAG: ParB/RepB/Spo0J family partition protein [Pseudolabrys sp.]|nr:ParB/RepB/Spo0J family partition protein [Pseudolabrys sp.]MBV9260505.1 ParB/RepB/Spo0J family partition protein [Pseudolabrys sp.]